MDWTEVKQRGDALERSRDELAAVAQRYDTLQQQVQTAEAAFRAALTAYAAESTLLAAPAKKTYRRVPCANGCGRDIGVGTQGSHDKACPALHAGAAA